MVGRSEPPAGSTVMATCVPGSGIAIDGRLEWREWEKDGIKRQAVDIIAELMDVWDQQTRILIP